MVREIDHKTIEITESFCCFLTKFLAMVNTINKPTYPSGGGGLAHFNSNQPVTLLSSWIVIYLIFS